MSEDDTTSHSASTPHPPPDQPNAAEATAREPSAARTVQRGEPDNGGERDSGSVEIEGAVKHAEACARAFKKAVRRTVDEAWELGDALRLAKPLISHGHWKSWLEKIGVHPRLAQRCMALRNRFSEKGHMSLFKSINAALRFLPAAGAIDAEFKADDSTGGSEPKQPTAPSAGSNSASDSSVARNPNKIPAGFSDETSAGISERPRGSMESGIPHLPGIETPSSRTAATPSSGDTDSQAGKDVDPRSLLEDFDGLLTRLDTELGREPATATQRLRPHFRPWSQILRALASTMADCLEATGEEEACGEDVAEDLVPTLQRLLKAVPERGRPRSDNSENRT